MKKSLVQRLRKIPESTGVYMMKGEKGEYLYVGKANNLRERLSHYIHLPSNSSPRLLNLVEKVREIDFFVVESERDALILENSLIKEKRPIYNVRLKDDKTYPSLRLDSREPFPCLKIVRKVKPDGALYFGPFTSSRELKTILKLISSIYPLRRCRGGDFKRRNSPCLNYEIKICSAPCSGFISEEDYRKMVDEVLLFLRGRKGEVLKRLKERMKKASEELNFEMAARLRDAIRVIEKWKGEKFPIMQCAETDFIGLCKRGDHVFLSMIMVKEGKVVNKKDFSLDLYLGDEREFLSSFLVSYYAEDSFIPEEIAIPEEIPDGMEIEEILSVRAGKKVRLIHPKKGEKRRLLQLSISNARALASAEVTMGEDEKSEEMRELSDIIGMTTLPERIEGYDISSISGDDAVAGMVVFMNGVPERSSYRRFRIKGGGRGDTDMMEEVLRRRFEKGEELGRLPDLIVLDGGLPQLHTGQKVLTDLSLPIPLVAFAKGKGRKGLDLYISALGGKRILEECSPAANLLLKMRKEFHRFAITYHRKVRNKRAMRSGILEVKGIGEKRRRLLLNRFGSLQGILSAPAEEISKVLRISNEMAERMKGEMKEKLA